MKDSSIIVNINLTLYFENKGRIEKVIPFKIHDSDICDLIYDDFNEQIRDGFNINDAFFTYTANRDEFIDEIIENNIDNIIDDELIEISPDEDDDITEWGWTWERA